MNRRKAGRWTVELSETNEETIETIPAAIAAIIVYKNTEKHNTANIILRFKESQQNMKT